MRRRPSSTALGVILGLLWVVGGGLFLSAAWFCAATGVAVAASGLFLVGPARWMPGWISREGRRRRGAAAVLTGLGLCLLAYLVVHPARNDPALAAVPAALIVSAAVVNLVAARRAQRRREASEPSPPAPQFVRAWRMPSRTQVWPAWLAVAAVWIPASTVIAWTLVVVPPQRGNNSVEPVVGHLAGVFAIAAAVMGLIGAAVATTRLPRRLAQRELEPQPHSRWLSRQHLLAVTAIALGVAAMSWAAAWADFEPGAYALATATVGLLVGPSVVVAAVVARRVETLTAVAVTARELLLAACTRRPIPAPEPAQGLVFPPTHTSTSG